MLSQYLLYFIILSLDALNGNSEFRNKNAKIDNNTIFGILKLPVSQVIALVLRYREARGRKVRTPSSR